MSAGIAQISDKQLNYKCKEVVWCPTMDLMCVLGQEGVFEIHRLINQHQKVFSKEDKLSPSQATFHQDGRHFALCYNCGRISIFPSDSGEVLVSLDIHSAPICCMIWKDYVIPQEPTSVFAQIIKPEIPAESSSVTSSWPWTDFPIPSKSKASFLKTVFVRECEKLSFLISADIEASIIISALGVYPIAKIPIAIKEIHIRKIVVANDFSEMAVLGVNTSHNSSVVMEIDSFLLNRRASQIENLSRVIPEIEELIVYLDSLVDQCQSNWQNVVKNLQMKFSPLLDEIDGPNKESVMCEMFREYLITGSAAHPLAQFISKEVYDCKILPKLDDVLSMLLKNMEESIEEQNGILERLILRINQLLAYSELKDQYGVLGLNSDMLKGLREMIECMRVSVESLLLDIIEAKAGYRNMLICLNEGVIRVAKEISSTPSPDIDNAKNHLAKLTVDRTSLMDLFKNKDSFLKTQISALINKIHILYDCWIDISLRKNYSS